MVIHKLTNNKTQKLRPINSYMCITKKKCWSKCSVWWIMRSGIIIVFGLIKTQLARHTKTWGGHEPNNLSFKTYKEFATTSHSQQIVSKWTVQESSQNTPLDNFLRKIFGHQQTFSKLENIILSVFCWLHSSENVYSQLSPHVTSKGA